VARTLLGDRGERAVGVVQHQRGCASRPLKTPGALTYELPLVLVEVHARIAPTLAFVPTTGNTPLRSEDCGQCRL